MPKKAAHSLEASSKTVALPKELNEVAEMLKSQDIKVIDQAVEAWSAFAAIKPEAADKLLAKVGVYADGEWDQGARFSRNDEDRQKPLSYALLSLLSRAPADTRGAFLRENIKTLEIITPEIPLLLGFKGLQSLNLRIEQDNGAETCRKLYWEERVSALPNLQRLELFVPNERCTPKSLKAFGSACLEWVDVCGEFLQSIEGLEISKVLRVVKISNRIREMDYAVDLSPLRPSSSTLNDLDINFCQVDDLAPIADCKDLRVIKMLQSKVRSIKDLPVLSGESLVVPSTVTSLAGIEKQHAIKKLVVHSDAGEDLRLIDSLSSLESLCLDFNYDFSLKASDWPALTGLTGLKRLEIVGPTLESLPTQWPPSLVELEVEHCYEIASLGALPPSLQGLLNLGQNRKLGSLDGIEACNQLKEVEVNLKCKDISAACQLTDTWIIMRLKSGSRPSDIAPWVEQLAAAPSCKLRPVIKECDRRNELSDLNAFAAIPGLRALDLSSLDVRDPFAILSMNNLEYLQVRPRSELSKKFGAITIKGVDKIAALKLKLLALG